MQFKPTPPEFSEWSSVVSHAVPPHLRFLAGEARRRHESLRESRALEAASTRLAEKGRGSRAATEHCRAHFARWAVPYCQEWSVRLSGGGTGEGGSVEKPTTSEGGGEWGAPMTILHAPARRLRAGIMALVAHGVAHTPLRCLVGLGFNSDIVPNDMLLHTLAPADVGVLHWLLPRMVRGGPGGGSDDSCALLHPRVRRGLTAHAARAAGTVRPASDVRTQRPVRVEWGAGASVPAHVQRALPDVLPAGVLPAGALMPLARGTHIAAVAWYQGQLWITCAERSVLAPLLRGEEPLAESLRAASKRKRPPVTMVPLHSPTLAAWYATSRHEWRRASTLLAAWQARTVSGCATSSLYTPQAVDLWWLLHPPRQWLSSQRVRRYAAEGT